MQQGLLNVAEEKWPFAVICGEKKASKFQTRKYRMTWVSPVIYFIFGTLQGRMEWEGCAVKLRELCQVRKWRRRPDVWISRRLGWHESGWAQWVGG